MRAAVWRPTCSFRVAFLCLASLAGGASGSGFPRTVTWRPRASGAEVVQVALALGFDLVTQVACDAEEDGGIVEPDHVVEIR